MLSDTKCRNAKPGAKPLKLPDGKGLYLMVMPNGTKAWRYRFKLTKGGETRESVYAIGHYAAAPPGESKEQAAVRRAAGGFTLEEARQERLRARGLVKQGINPAHYRQQQRQKVARDAEASFEIVARAWIEGRDWTQATKDERLRLLQRVAFPQIGAIPVKQIESASILSLLKAAAKKNGPTVAAQARTTIFKVFELAREEYGVTSNPVLAWQEALPKNKTQHKRALTPKEIGEFLRDLDGRERNVQTVAAFRLMWLTLCRPSEVTGARWSEIDLEAAAWTIGSERMKKRMEHRVPLPAQAVNLLKSLQPLTGHRPHVFPHRDRRSEPMTDANLRQALHAMGWAGRYSPHATRTTGSTILNEQGYPADWIERQLAHGEPNRVRSTYNHARHFADRTRMMQAWADYLDSLKNGAGNVVPLHAA
ncbi:MAG: tyrosine-type recombinase/integrase [Pseudomonadota bacterium]